MTRRERLEAKLEKRAEWAQGRDAKAAASFGKYRAIADNIPLGQPILVDHYSAPRHRRDIGRMDSAISAAVESTQMAAHHRAKADGLEAQLESSIFSDDPDAPEALAARIAELEAQRAAMKASNAAFRKGDAAWSALLGITLEQAAARRARIMEGYSWCRQPHPTYSLSNLGGNINRLKKRQAQVAAMRERQVKAEAAGVLVEGTADYVRVTFPEKPTREILNALRAAGFQWGGGSWTGVRRNLPLTVSAMAGGAA